MSNYQHVIKASEENFELRPWGGYMCFLGTPEKVNCRELCDAAVLRMQAGLRHDSHFHEDCDEIIHVLSGTGRQTFWDENDKKTSYDLHPGDTLYIAKNRVHLTDNIEPQENLMLFIINYRVEGQSDPNVSGLITAESTKEQPAEYGSITNIIYEDTCGNQSVSGSVLTLLPGKEFHVEKVKKEDLIFALEGNGEISYNSSSQFCPFEKGTMGFFHETECYSIRNVSPSPVKLFYLHTL